MKRFHTSRVSFLGLALIFMFTLSGCKKEDPNPELHDPIFADLDRRANEAQKSLDEEKKKIEDAQKALEKAEPNSIDLKNAQRDLAKAQHNSLDLDQKARYYKIRAQRRLLVDRITYQQAFAKNQPWPDPREYSEYLVNMRLQESPRNWAVRVPKLQDRLSKTAGSGQKEAPKEAKAEE